MTRSIARWIAAAAAAGIVALPVHGQAQSAPEQPPAAQQPPAQPPTTEPTSPQPPASAGQKNPEEAKRHLTAARNSLSELTQLPAAQQLTGDARTQVSELITNFNALITTTADWPAAYAKVENNLSSLLGSQSTDESPARTAATAGAVGTSGSATLSPDIREKLIAFRGHLEQFEKAAGGVPATPDAEAPATPPSATASGTAATGTTAETTGGQTAGTQPTAQSGMSRDEALQHIQAIETILAAQPSAAGTSGTGTPGTAGTSGSTAGATGTSGAAPITLDASQVQQLRTHLTELRRIINQK